MRVCARAHACPLSGARLAWLPREGPAPAILGRPCLHSGAQGESCRKLSPLGTRGVTVSVPLYMGSFRPFTHHFLCLLRLIDTGGPLNLPYAQRAAVSASSLLREQDSDRFARSLLASDRSVCVDVQSREMPRGWRKTGHPSTEIQPRGSWSCPVSQVVLT